MKSKRQAKIVELISQRDIETQEELAALLNQAGFSVTQATVSRDIRALKLSKINTPSGKQKYVLIEDSDEAGRMGRVLREGYVSSTGASNLVVIHTVSGMAMAVAAAIDGMDFPGLAGCIAGDDTVFCAVKERADVDALMEEIHSLTGTR